MTGHLLTFRQPTSTVFEIYYAIWTISGFEIVRRCLQGEESSLYWIDWFVLGNTGRAGYLAVSPVSPWKSPIDAVEVENIRI
jgi:hypothetical protein